MSIRLSKIAKELNVGVSTVVDFLSKKGFNVDGEDLNAKLSDDEESLLRAEFDKDSKQKIDAEKLSQNRTTKNNRGSVQIEGFEAEAKRNQNQPSPLCMRTRR